MNPNEMNKLKEKAPFAFVFLLLAVFLPSVFITPVEEELIQKDNEYKVALTKSKKILDLNKKGILDAKKFAKLFTTQEEMNCRFPDRDNLPDVIEEIHNKAKLNDAVIKNVRYEFNREIEDIAAPSYRIQFQISAGYQNFRRFIAELECLKFPLIIREVVATNNSNFSVTVQQMVKL